MSHHEPSRGAPEIRPSESSRSSKKRGNLLDTVSSYWDEVYEASDLVKFMRAGDEETIVTAEEDTQNHCVGGEEDSSASGVGTELNYSSTSSASLMQQDCQEKQSGSKGDSSQLQYPSRLKIHAAKIALNSGKQHLSVTGQVRKARNLKNPCNSTCRRCQPLRVTTAERRVVLDYFWSLKSHEKQWEFISNAVKVCTPKRKFVAEGTKGGKSCSRAYFLSINGEDRRVCKTMFVNTLCICDSWIDSALAHIRNGLPDLRGKRKLK